MPEQPTNKPSPQQKPKSAARKLQESVEKTDPQSVHTIPVVLRFADPDVQDVHIELTPDAIHAILDPDVADTFIKVPSDTPNSLKHRYLHTKSIDELLFNQDLPERNA
jgi:hypothetical protein